jgi:hypothetical protein
MIIAPSPSVRPAKFESSAPIHQPPVVSLMTMLQQLQDVVSLLSDEQYAMRPVGVIESSIGGHVRHCLDHVRALLCCIKTSLIDYDARERGTSIETDRTAALEAIGVLRLDLTNLPADMLDRPVGLSVMMTSDGPPIRVGTTVGREMAYVLSHTIHHNALVGTMVKMLGGWLPDRFGYAPSTLAHLKSISCAP